MEILKRIFIGVAISLIAWFLKTDVFALTVDSRLQYLDYQENVVNTSYVSAGSLMSITPTRAATFTRVFVRFSQPFVAGTTYRFEYQYNVSRYDYEFRNAPCGNGFSVTTGAEIVSSSCSSAAATQNVVVSVKVNEPLSSITIGSIYMTGLIANQTYNFRVVADSWDITDLDSTYEAITNNTVVISNAIEGVSNYIDFQTAVIETIRDMIYDLTYATIGSESANTYSRSYSGTNTSGLGQNDYAGSSGLGSGGSGGYGFDFSGFTGAFAFIFAKVQDFLNINLTFLAYLINIITLGFIGLVLNR